MSGGLFTNHMGTNWLQDSIIGGLLKFTGSQKFLTAQLNITNACNLSCVHCYHAHHSNAGALDFQGWRSILDQYERLAKKLYLKPFFVICGGEPTISSLFIPMLKELNSRWPGVRVDVLTNGTRLARGFTESLRQFNLGIQISLDGPDRERHDLIRGHGSFDQTLSGLNNLQEAGLNAWFLATLSHRTSLWIEDFFKMAAISEVEGMNFTRFIPEGTGRLLEESHADRPLSGVDLRDTYAAILKSSKGTGVATNTNGPLFHLIDSNLGANGKAGFQGLIIDYKGNLKFSSRVDFKLGNILEEGLENLFLGHPLMRALRNREIEGCGTCVHYEHCGGDRNASFVATGSFLKKDPGCWLDTAPQEVVCRKK
ncbi:MAG: radical SAM protein [Elusimicrobia bacterium]|nr:radical SAM protein [Elusimicrobiota bacterium]